MSAMKAVTTLLICVAMTVTGAARADENAERRLIWDEARAAFLEQDFEALDEWADSFRATEARTASGEWKLYIFYATFKYREFLYDDRTEETLQRMEDDVGAWLQERPDSVAANIVLSLTMLNRAVFFRGEDYAHTVTPEGWQGYFTHNDRAYRHLMATRDRAGIDPEWHTTMLRVLGGTGDRYQDWRAVAAEGLALHPRYSGLIHEIVRLNLPQWGGDNASLEQAARHIAALPDGDGDVAYAHVYRSAADQLFLHELFFVTEADWRRMRSGFRELLELYPTDWNRNTFARFACSAQDIPATRELLDDLAERILPDLWDDRRQSEFCRDLVDGNIQIHARLPSWEAD